MAPSLDQLARHERDRLVRVCAHLSQDPQAAEDLAQDTLLEAVRSETALRDPMARRRWLWGIARNICRRQRRNCWRERTTLSFISDDETSSSLAARAYQENDADADLERAELKAVIDRAMAMLPPETRIAMVARYIEDRQDREIAERLGMSESGVRVKLHRGRALLRRLLVEELGEMNESFGLPEWREGDWRETRMWCPVCGTTKLLGQLRHDPAEFALRCTRCCPNAGIHVAQAVGQEIIGHASGFKIALSRVSVWAYGHYRQALLTGVLSCGQCRHTNRIHIGLPSGAAGWAGIDEHSIYAICDRCGTLSLASVPSLSLALQETRSFWRTHPRIRMVPTREIEFGGQTALLTQVESLSNQVALDIVWANDTYEVLQVCQS